MWAENVWVIAVGGCKKNMRCDVAFGYQFIICSEADENEGKR
jgi:hypothetical protein